MSNDDLRAAELATFLAIPRSIFDSFAKAHGGGTDQHIRGSVVRELPKGFANLTQKPALQYYESTFGTGADASVRVHLNLLVCVPKHLGDIRDTPTLVKLCVGKQFNHQSEHHPEGRSWRISANNNADFDMIQYGHLYPLAAEMQKAFTEQTKPFLWRCNYREPKDVLEQIES